MKQGLEHIYREVSAGRLSQREALERIRELKRPSLKTPDPVVTLQAAPVWEALPTTPGMVAPSYAEQQVLLHGLPGMDVASLARHLGGKPVIRSLPDHAALGLAAHYQAVAAALFEALQDVLRRKPLGQALVQLAVADGADAEVFAGLAGLIETATLEYPDLSVQIVFVDGTATAGELADWLTAGAAVPRRRVLRYAGKKREWRSWRELAAAPTGQASPFKEHGVYLITGGLGGLGVLVAREILARTTAARVVLCGRASPDSTRARLDALQAGGRVAYRQTDVGDPAAVQALVDGITADYGQLNGIVHSAGVLRDAFIVKKSRQQFDEVLLPKVGGAENLDLASRTLPLDFFLLFSSIAVWAGNVGQADYAAANGFLDGFAASRQARVAAGARHGKTVSIAWPHWLEGGMNIDAASLAQLEQRTGLRSMATAAGMQALQQALASHHSHIMVMHGVAAEMRRALEGPADEPALPAPPAVPVPAPGAAAADLPSRTRAYLREAFSQVLKIPLQRIETKAPLENYGIDSILAMRLTSHLEASFGALPKTLFFEYLSIDELAGYFVRAHADTLAGMLTTADAAAAPVAAAQPNPPVQQGGAQSAKALPSRRRRSRRNTVGTGAQTVATHGAVPPPPAREPIAIVGMSGRYPEARDLDAFWANLRDGRDCITEVPAQRWDWRQYYSEDRTREGAHFSKWGGFIEGADEFDPRFFHISPREAATLDPQERLFLQHAWMAVEDAGFTRGRLQTTDALGLPGQVGVYAGVMYGEYNPSGTLASIANRVSYFLNLHGPSLTLDTMCSSSLTAIHLACQDLYLGRTCLALAGGVNLSVSPDKYTMLSAGQFISGDGHCQSFGEGGDGYIPGEGVGVIVLKRLSDAERDGDHIYGLVRASALNHGGKTNGYTVPNPRAQTEVIQRALAEAGADPRQVNYLEAHGTGTRLGDPIEIAALTQAFHQAMPQTAGEAGFCLVGSAKSNIGHCESAAGIAGVTKVLLQLKHGMIVPSLHSRRLNPNIDFGGTPFVVVQDLQPWQAPVIDGVSCTRMAGVSSFGAGGSNAHVIIEEYAGAQMPVAAQPTPLLVPLSARTADQLTRRAADLLAFIDRAEPTLDLGSLAWTLQIGREAMDERVAFIAGSVDHLAAQLRAFVADGASEGEVFHDQARKHRDALAALEADATFAARLADWHAQRNLPELAKLWSRGLELDWHALAGGQPPRTMSLPTYPFARESYWRARPAGVTTSPVAAIAAPQRKAPLPRTPAQRAETLVAAAQAKPSGIRLAIPTAVPQHDVGAKPVLQLQVASPPPAEAGGPESPVQVFEHTPGIVTLEIHQPLAAVIEALRLAMQDVARHPDLKAVLLSGRHAAAWTGDRDCANAAVRAGLFGALARLPAPTIALAPQGASGAGMLLAAVCDFLVAGETALYGFVDADRAYLPSAAEDRYLRDRLGDATADALLYRSGPRTGSELHAVGWACRVVADEVCVADAGQLATILAEKPGHALHLLKGHLARDLTPLIDAFTEYHPASGGGAGQVRVVHLDEVAGPSQIDHVKAALAGLADPALPLSSLVLHGGKLGFLPELQGSDADPAVFLDLLSRLQAAPVPVVAALECEAVGWAWLFALACDAVIHERQMRYAATPAWSGAAAQHAAAVCAMRLGPAAGYEVALTGREYQGSELAQLAPALLAATKGDVMPRALALAQAWEAWPVAQLGAWKQAQAQRHAELLEALPAPAIAGETASMPQPMPMTAPGLAQNVPLGASVVRAAAYPDGVIVLTLADKPARNRFSPELIAGLTEAFAHIAATPAYKAVVMTGFDSYFATGGTTDTLLAIQEGQAQFTDETIFQAAMDCELPVIAAMQGHGIGGGWSFGMFADLVLLSAESRYLSPYMDYGFTPGAGSTLMLPAKLGLDLARESLLSARESSGQELMRRGLALRVLPRKQVLALALALAAQLACRSRDWLVAQKRMWTHGLRAAREGCYHRELRMHEATFVANDATLARIQSRLGVAAEPPAATREPAAGVTVAAVLPTLKDMLAQELLLQVDEIEDDTPFIDLGLDSITGVTWVRKINARYGTDIEATQVYSHPTLKQLGALVAEASTVVAAAPPPPVDRVAPRETTPATAGRLSGILDKLRLMLARELLLQPEEIEAATPFIELGLDSITGVTWVRKINEAYGTDIAATEVYSHPTLSDIAALVMRASAGAAQPGVAAAPSAAGSPAAGSPAAGSSATSAPAAGAPVAAAVLPTPAAQPAPPPASFRVPIAIIGMAGQFAQAADIEEFWQNLAAGRDSITEVPAARWDCDAYYQAGPPTPGKTNSRWMGALDAYDLFDPLFFNISPTEAESMEPQQRVFLQACWHGIENAGYSAASLSGQLCGVFVGCGPSEYHRIAPAQQHSAQGFTGAASSILASRISYLLNLRGPCIAIETACSSSLVAIANACDSLNTGSSDLALAGGVYVMAGPAMHIMTSQAGMLSPDGRCFTFDQRANGFVPGEGVGVVLLKRLTDAQRDGDRIVGVIEGWGVNQDGKTNGMTAPNQAAQTELLQSVYRRFGIDPAGIQLVEAHGTGTKLGDPIEIAGLKAAFQPHARATGYCALGSVKSNIGHCLTAAGIAGVIKVVQAMLHQTLPPTLHYRQCNEHIQLDGSPFYINDACRAWEVAPGERRRGAVSSFGFSGTNAHLVLAEAPAMASPPVAATVLAEDGKLMVPLSARTALQLRHKAEGLLAWLQRHPGARLTDLAYTLQLGRDAMAERLGVMAGTLEELAARLQAYLAGEDSPGVHQGHIKRDRDEVKLLEQDDDMRAMVVEKWLDERRLSRLLALWAKGLAFDWRRLYAAPLPQRIELPNYPFARERYWLEPEAMPPSRPAQAASSREIQSVTGPQPGPVATEPPAVATQESGQDGAVPALTETQLLEATLGFCTQLVGQALKLDAALIDVTEPLESYGIDSISVGLINRLLQQHFEDVGATLLYEHRTVEALARHLFHTQREVLNRLLGADGQAASTSASTAVKPQALTTSPATAAPIRHEAAHADQRGIAIIGLSGQYPMADTLDAFWDNLKSGRDCITEIPPSRWTLDGFYEPDERAAVAAGKSYCKWGGFVEGFAQFDALFFGIPPREALNMDPQERLFMQTAWAALENAGYTRAALKRQFGGRVGVFAGITRAGYNLYRMSLGEEDRFWPRTSFSSVANRLSYFLDIHGPSMPVDTMCSSSLTAIHEACEHIRNGDCDLALAGGVNLYLHPTSYVDMSSQHMLSGDGRCRSFGVGANGFVPGEGVGVVLLKPLERAIADQDLIHGVILATQVNHGGKTNGFTVPNPVAQAELIRGALKKAGIGAGEVSYIEAHGTGTDLGDPIEIAGLQQAFAVDTQERGFCRIGSAKSNVGHLEAAAGIAGLTKVLLQFRHGQIAPTLHAGETNPHIRFEKTPFVLNRQLVDWERPVIDGEQRPRIAGVSSFGAGGANAHVIVQEFVPAPVKAPIARTATPGVVVPLSAGSEERLRQMAHELAAFLETGEARDLAAVAYTLQVGREAMDVRLAMVVDSMDGLCRRLRAFAAGTAVADDVHHGMVPHRTHRRPAPTPDEMQTLESDARRGDYAPLLDLWVQGMSYDWTRLYEAGADSGGAPPARIELPTYPFARETYWIDSVTGGKTDALAPAAPVASPRPAQPPSANRDSMRVIEDIISRIDDDALDVAEGAQMLRKLV